jgi:hypothetical protein
VILQRHRRTKHSHDAVAGELAQHSAIALHYRRRPLDQFGHDFPQPLRTDRRCDVHRMDNIGEQDGHLLVLRRCGGWPDRRAALVAEP